MKVLMIAPLMLLALAGCTTDNGSVTPPMDEAGRYVIQMTGGLLFNPSNFEVPSGATVVFQNVGSVWHDVTPDGHSAWAATGQIDGGEEFEITAGSPGSYKFYCSPHKANGMTGTMTVI